MTNIEHILFGRHSNIPECCIKFFIVEWNQNQDETAYERDPNKQIEYVRCERCLKENQYFPIHKCTLQCEKFLKNIGRWEALKWIL